MRGELPKELANIYDLIDEGGQRHWLCKKCNIRVCTVTDAVYHAITHDQRLRRLLKELSL